jgi:N6-L-threonylcarbamoyladenine synthase
MSIDKDTYILAIETSCDETAVSIVKDGKNGLEILSNQISSQVKLHAKWGGVVPNLAAREHVKNIPHIFKNALGEAKISMSQIDAIAITNGPGLIPALLVGTGVAKTISYLWNKPLLGIHHIEGHIYANFIGENDKFKMTNSKQIQNSKSKNIQKKYPSKIGNWKLEIENSTSILFPALVLVVSGGHTQLVLMEDHLRYKIIGQTLDDAAGEAFDKVARILNIGYPGGPAVALRARNFQFPISNFQKNSNDKISNVGKNTRYKIQDTKYNIRLPRPMISKKNLDFSFSGIKTAVLYETKKRPELLKDETYISELCHEFQQAVIDVFIHKTLKAAELYKPKTIMLAGGVSANKELREQLGIAIDNSLPNVIYKIPDINLTGDNAAMIGAAAIFRWKKMTDSQKKKSLEGWKNIQPNANLKFAK